MAVTDEDRELAAWGAANGHIVMVTEVWPRWVTDCTCRAVWGKRSASVSAANTVALNHLEAMRSSS